MPKKIYTVEDIQKIFDILNVSKLYEHAELEGIIGKKYFINSIKTKRKLSFEILVKITDYFDKIGLQIND